MTDVTEESGRSATRAGAGSPGAASPVAHLSAAERAARGKAARSEVPRASHAEWEPSSARPDPIGLLEQQAQTRVPELVPIRYGRMLVSPFTFYRGAALIMASDLAATPRAGVSRAALRRCPSLELRDLRDARAEHDVRHQRLRRDPSRPVGVGRQAPGREPRRRRPRPRLLGQAARRGRPGRRGRVPDGDARFAARTNVEVWYAHLDVEKTVAEYAGEFSAAQVAKTDAAIAKARTKDSLQAFGKLTHLVDGKPRIVSDPPLIVPVEELFEGRDWQDLEQEMRTCSATTAAPSPPTVAGCSSSTSSPTSRARSSESAASAPAPGSRSSSAATTRIRSSCRSRRRRRRCSRRSSAAVSSTTMANASSPDSA